MDNTAITDVNTAGRTVRTINREWLFCYDPQPEPRTARAAPDHAPDDFQAVALPHTWHTYATTGERHPFIRDPSEYDTPYWWHGWGWYRKVFRVDRRHRGNRVFMEFDAVQKYCQVYCNGVRLAEHAGGFTGFSVDLTDSLQWDRPNMLAVAVSARQDGRFGAIPPMRAGNWNTYGGIYRDVRLVIKPGVHIPFQGSAEHEGGTFITTPAVNHDRAQVRITTYVHNTTGQERTIDVQQEIVDPDGQSVACFSQSVSLPPRTIQPLTQDSPAIVPPRLWSPESPALYRVHTRLRDAGVILDSITSPLGLRWFHWDRQARCLYLNDRRVRITGMNRHQEYPWLGDALPRRFHENDLRDMRENLGVNFARWCHYPQDAFVYDWCDRHGILVCEETPCIKDLPFSPGIQRRQVMEMIRRDRNHPCIIMWSMGNETNNAADGRWARAEDATRLIHYRKVSGPTPEADHTHADLDMENLLRCTIRGWWEPEAMDGDCAPLPPDAPSGQITGTEAWQHAAARIRDGNIRGRIDDDTVVWIYADHGAARIYRHCPLKHINPKGWVDAYRQPKQIYWLWQANRTRRLMVHIRDYWWRPAMLGTRRDLVVDSNGAEVELYVGEESIGRQYPNADNFHSVVFKDVMVRPAELRAVARRDGESVTHVVLMSGPPTALHLQAAPGMLCADRADIALVTVDVIDEHSVPVIGARPRLAWEIQGPGTLLAPAAMASDIDLREALEGSMYIVTPVIMPVRSQGRPGEITVRVTAPGLRPAELVIPSRAPAALPDDGIEEPALPADVPEHFTGRRPAALAGAGEDSKFYADIETGAAERDTVRRRIRQAFDQIAPLDAADPAAEAMLERLTDLAQAGNGVLIADDANFHLQQYRASRKK